jgi:hypothetical protein
MRWSGENSTARLTSISAARAELVSHTATQLWLGESGMSRYYFHVRRGQITILDHEGIVLADTSHAKVEAVQRAQSLMNGETLDGASATRRSIVVADNNWDTLFEFPF